MSKICIICRTPQLEFSVEHCFQKAIGGRYVTKKVCKTCNENRLNTNIDIPFINHIQIAVFRFIHDHKSYGRGVPNPLKGRYIIQNGEKHLASLTKELNIKSFLPPKYPDIKNMQLGEEFKLELDGSEKNNISTHLKKLAKKLNVPEDDIRIKDIKITNRPEGKYTFSNPNLPLIMGFAKILYEITIDLIPGYFEDETAKRYAAMLYCGVLDDSLRSVLEPDAESIKNVYQIISKIQYKNEHLVFITGYPGVGLIGIIKVYGIFHVMVLSKSKEYWTMGWTLVSNNYKENKLGIYKPNRIADYELSLRFNCVSDSNKIDDEFNSKSFHNDYPLYNFSGEKIFNLNSEIINSNYSRTINTDFKTYFDLTFPIEGTLFIKSKNLNTLIAIESIKINIGLSKTNNPNT